MNNNSTRKLRIKRMNPQIKKINQEKCYYMNNRNKINSPQEITKNRNNLLLLKKSTPSFLTFESDEIKKFTKITKHRLPNTKRTLQAEYAPSVPLKTGKKRIYEGNYEKIPPKLFQRKIRGNDNVYNDNFALDNSDNHRYLNINNDTDFYEDLRSKKRQLHPSIYANYKNYSQIIGLPGSRKRNEHEINDDYDFHLKALKSKKQPNFTDKLINDYFSNVTCLPNSLTTKYKKRKIISDNNFTNYFERNNTFNNYYYKDYNDEKHDIYSDNKYYQNYYTTAGKKTHINAFSDLPKNGKKLNLLKLKNLESSFTFDMLKPSTMWKKKYEGVIKIF